MRFNHRRFEDVVEWQNWTTLHISFHRVFKAPAKLANMLVLANPSKENPRYVVLWGSA